MMARLGAPPGWAGEGYGAQPTPGGWRAWAIHQRIVCWLGPPFASMDHALEAALFTYQQLQSEASSADSPEEATRVVS